MRAAGALVRPCALLATGAVLALAAGGCGGETVVDTVTVTAPASTSASDASATTPTSTRSASRWKSCDANIKARRGTTTCGFAENVFYGFWNAEQAGDDSFSAYSPATKKSYAMTCNAGASIVCRAGDGGAVRFSRAAVDSYTSANARAYRCNHDVDGDGVGATCTSVSNGSEPSEAAADSSAADGCSPEYEGACVPDNVGDVDCTELSDSDFSSVGSDPYGLDADGDGIACES